MYALGKQRLVSGAKAIACALITLCVAAGLGSCTPVPNAGPSPSGTESATELATASARPTPGEGGSPGDTPGAGPFPSTRPTRTVTAPGGSPEPSPTTYYVTETGPLPEESSPPPGSTSTAFERARRAKEILETCLEGELTFRPPSPMRQGETREFVLHVTMGDPGAGHEEKIPGSNPVQTRAPIVCEEMRADLSGPGMDIERAGNASGEMLVPEQGVAEWSWWITPREAGRKTLTLQLFATAEDGPDLSLETFREVIQVEIELGYVLNAIVKDWAQPLGVTIPVLIGAIGAILVWSRSRQRKAKHAANTASKE
jgi:hypothetical protein